MCLARLARQHVKVVLSGDGGDEAFGGYARYAHDLREAAVRAWLPRIVRRNLLGPASRVWPKADWLPKRLRLKTALTNLSLDDAVGTKTTTTATMFTTKGNKVPIRFELTRLVTDHWGLLEGRDLTAA